MNDQRHIAPDTPERHDVLVSRAKWAFFGFALIVGYFLVTEHRADLALAIPDGVIYGNGRVEVTEVRVAREVAGKVVTTNLIDGRMFRRGEGAKWTMPAHENAPGSGKFCPKRASGRGAVALRQIG